MSLLLAAFTRPRTRPATTIVLHATGGGSLSGAIAALQARGLSYHFLIDKDGRRVKLAPIGRIAWHCGRSTGPEGSNVNAYSIGISAVNRNNGTDPYPSAQVRAIHDLVMELVSAEKALRWLTTHRAISAPRKTDPLGLDPRPFARDSGLIWWAGLDPVYR